MREDFQTPELVGDVGVVHDCKRGNFHGESSGLVPFLSLLFLNRSLVSFEYLMVNNKLGVVGYKNVGFVVGEWFVSEQSACEVTVDAALW